MLLSVLTVVDVAGFLFCLGSEKGRTAWRPLKLAVLFRGLHTSYRPICTTNRELEGKGEWERE
jgi:hypothetical protein